jgi:predicted O-linked N-acetylglucosamine transferase (SPINDLY family)
MDYLISDANCIKTDEENQYSEKIIYMPNIWNSMSKPSTLPDISELPFNKEKIFTFGSFNNFQKISNKTISIWSKILNNTNSRLILKNSIMDNEEINQNLKEKFFDNKVQKDKIHIINFQSKSFDHLSFYNKIDLALDTFPYNGVTTTFESVLMGVPVLTLKGFNFNSRCGESINKNLELENFIAENYDDYYFKAFNFYENKNYLNDLRKVLRNKAILSPLFDNTNFASVFSEKMKIVWDNFLKG